LRSTRFHPQQADHFSGIVVCSACGNRLRADGNYTSRGKHYGYYRDQAMTRGL